MAREQGSAQRGRPKCMPPPTPALREGMCAVGTNPQRAGTGRGSSPGARESTVMQTQEFLAPRPVS